VSKDNDDFINELNDFKDGLRDIEKTNHNPRIMTLMVLRIMIC